MLDDEGASVATKTYISLLQSCIDSKSIAEGRQLHEKIGLVRNPTAFVETKLVSMYAKCGDLEEARKVFAAMHERNLFSWSALINGFAREHRWEEVLGIFFQMIEEGVTPDAFLFPKFLQACANLGDAETGRLLHSLAVRTGLSELAVEAHVSNSILAMYAKCGELGSAKRFFDKMGTRDRVSWNSLISGHCQCGELEEALRLFERMLQVEGIEPGLVTWNILITSYNQIGKADVAMGLMKKMDHSGLVPDVVTWTSMISGFAQNNRPEQALDLFRQMQQAGVSANHVTFASTISACASLKDCRAGAQLHAGAAKAGYMYAKCGRLDEARRAFDGTAERDVFTWNSLIGGYAQAGYCGKAYDLFSRMEGLGVQRNVVTWNVMISGYLQSGDVDQAMELFRSMEADGVERSTSSWNLLISGSLQNSQRNAAMGIFRQMQSLGQRPNHISILSVLPACANILSHLKVKEIHACALRRHLISEVSVSNSMVDAYMKSGDVNSAESVFAAMPSRDVLSWNSLIDGYVLHCRPTAAVDVFRRMSSEGEVKPDHSTFAGLIHAYGLGGMVAEGRRLFASMTGELHVRPTSEHYAAMVHLFGRSARLTEATGFIEKMPLEPDSKVWAALLTAGRAHGDAASAKLAAENLRRLKPRNPVIKWLSLQLQAMLSGNGGDPPTASKLKRSSGGDEALGCCWVGLKYKVHTIPAGDVAMLGSEPIRKMLDGIQAARDRGRGEEEATGIRCEKIALAFSLVHSSSGVIRIVKNLRVSAGGHAAAKFISRAFQREILIKDPRSLHRFKDGQCSCGEYW
ncbi:unnamed protein product [Spirodela intermedia]|uniref:DYW domain-containing protein n=1 Tax=Spirodela intermedia TaxID=51605 RepID=A0A7I8J385_SPIIN|nr:unnamed protein product [Spirodela intermedia]CAA6664579.1 unnamed protein product [Spirodela intermedia]